MMRLPYAYVGAPQFAPPIETAYLYIECQRGRGALVVWIIPQGAPTNSTRIISAVAPLRTSIGKRRPIGGAPLHAYPIPIA